MNNKILISTTLACVAIALGTSLLGAQNGIDLLISSSTTMNVVRGLMIVMLVALLVTTPPRLPLLRAALGATAAVVVVVSIALFGEYRIGVFDMLLGIVAAVIMAIDALELEGREEKLPARLMS